MTETDMQTQVPHMFNAIAKRYDQVNRILSFGIDQKWRKQVGNYLPAKKNLRLLDLATGTCDQLLALMETKKIGQAVGIDLAEEMLTIGNQKIAASPFSKNIELKVASASSLPFADHSFDCVTIAFGIRNIQGNALQEMYRILTPGGRALILEFSLPKSRCIRFFHLFYLRHILPFIGGWITKEKSAYLYLNKTIEAFPYGDKFIAMMQQEGFVDCRAVPFTFGVATLYVGEKP